MIEEYQSLQLPIIFFLNIFSTFDKIPDTLQKLVN